MSILGKILAEKPISTQILHSTLFGIWCKPQGFQLNEIEGKLIQIKMDKEEDIQRILKGSLWIIRNCWFVLHGWNRTLDITTLDFTHVPLWIQFWGLPLHCKSTIIGKEMGNQLGTVLDAGLYEFPENAKVVKVKILFNLNHPIRAGMYIGSDDDGVKWVDFRYENLPMFCFGCGLVGHNQEKCRNPPIKFEGGTNPRGAWLRSRTYGRRLIEKKEKDFSSNPLRSISGGSFSPIPKGLLNQMAAMKISRNGTPNSGQTQHQPNTPTPSSQKFDTPTTTTQLIIHKAQGGSTSASLSLKRKQATTKTMENHLVKDISQEFKMAGLKDEASHQQ